MLGAVARASLVTVTSSWLIAVSFVGRERLRESGYEGGPPLSWTNVTCAQPASPPPSGSRLAASSLGLAPANWRKSRFMCAWS